MSDHKKFDMTNHRVAIVCSNSAAPVSAPLDTQALPPLPQPHSVWEFSNAPNTAIFTVKQLHQAIAQYAERIRHLERELSELREASLAMSAELSKFQGAAYLAKIDGRTAGAAPAEPEYFYTFSRPDGWINLLNPGQSWEDWTREQGAPTTKGWKVFGKAAAPLSKQEEA